MVDFLKSFFSNADEQELVDALKNSQISSRKVIGRGTLTVDAKEVAETEEFKEYALKAAEIVRSYKKAS